jgi:hypothetical protein
MRVLELSRKKCPPPAADPAALMDHTVVPSRSKRARSPIALETLVELDKSSIVPPRPPEATRESMVTPLTVSIVVVETVPEATGGGAAVAVRS